MERATCANCGLWYFLISLMANPACPNCGYRGGRLTICQATTRKGAKCRGYALGDTGKCYRHGGR